MCWANIRCSWYLMPQKSCPDWCESLYTVNISTRYLVPSEQQNLLFVGGKTVLSSELVFSILMAHSSHLLRSHLLCADTTPLGMRPSCLTTQSVRPRAHTPRTQGCNSSPPSPSSEQQCASLSLRYTHGLLFPAAPFPCCLWMFPCPGGSRVISLSFIISVLRM